MNYVDVCHDPTPFVSFVLCLSEGRRRRGIGRRVLVDSVKKFWEMVLFFFGGRGDYWMPLVGYIIMGDAGNLPALA